MIDFLSQFSVKSVQLIRILNVALPEEELEAVCLSNVSTSCLSLNYDNCDVKL